MRAAIVATLVLGAAIGGCTQDDSPDFKLAKAAVANAFPYPSSVEFHALRNGSTNHRVCGEVRGRQLNGTMTDYRRFNWAPGADNLFIEGMGVSPSGHLELDTSMAKLNDAMLAIGC